MESKSRDKAVPREILLPSVKGLAVGVIFAAVLLFILTAVAYGMEDPDSVTPAFGYTALYLTAAVTGIASSRFLRDSGGRSALVGAASGLMLLVIILLLSFIPPEAESSVSPALCALMYAMIPAVSALTGFMARKRRSRKSRYRRRR